MSTARLAELGYALLGLAALALSLWHLRRPDRIGSALDALRVLQRRRVGRWLVLLGWWWLGWHLFAR
ncbi:MAG TPA: DUF6186 family protein [Mycobacteriales bacterium]|jgi:hypothetical protein|nr:DUF6186 family protein [Mycobacteriales bacterium]